MHCHQYTRSREHLLEKLESLVEVIDLDQKGSDHKDKKHPKEPILVRVVFPAGQPLRDRSYQGDIMTHPWMVETILAPKPCVHATLIPPIKLQILIYTNIVFRPYRGAAQNARKAEMTIQSDAQTRNPGERKSFLKPLMVVTDCSSGALRARMVAPNMHKVHPIHPCRQDRSTKIGHNDQRVVKYLKVWRDAHKKGQTLFQQEMR